MSDQFTMFDLTTSEGSLSATSSQVSACGVTPCASPDGLTIDLHGQDRARVNRSAKQARGSGSRTSGISFQRGLGLSKPEPLEGIQLDLVRFAVEESKCERLAAALRAKEQRPYEPEPEESGDAA